MRDFFGNEISVTQPHKFEYNKKELTITAVEREALLRGMAKAFESMLFDLRLIRNPRKEIVAEIEKIEQQLIEIRNEYGSFKSE